MLALAAATIFAILGLLHLGYTVHDSLTRPRYFQPRDPALLDALRQTKVALAPGGRDYWSTSLGFHYSHSIGALLFALLIVVTVQHEIGWLRPLLISVSAVYTLIAWRYWFHIPLAGTAAATVFLAVAWLL